MEFKNLLNLTDLNEKDKETLLEYGDTHASRRTLYSRSTVSEVRNLFRPPGELYLPVEYNKDYIVKLVKKETWGGHLLFLVMWDMVMVDVDDYLLEDIEYYIDKYYPDELFYIRQTNKGYHIYLLSKKASNVSKYAIFMHKRLHGDPAHGTNSLYTGVSVRLSHKASDIDMSTEVSRYICRYGRGEEDPELLALYNKIDEYITKYKGYTPENIHLCKDIIDGHKDIMEKAKTHMGALQLKVTSSLEMGENGENGDIEIQYQSKKETSDIFRHAFHNFVKFRVFKPYNKNYFLSILLGMHYSICNNNLYRVYEEYRDYAIVLHLQEYCKTIVYRDLLVVDYDNPMRLQILYRFVKRHPEYTFRIVRTTKGYHAFCTSLPINYRDSFELLNLLRSDPLHILSSIYKGYGVRINQKSIKEKGYRYYCTYGIAKEDERLVRLYDLHLEKYSENVQNKEYVMFYHSKTSKTLCDEFMSKLHA